MKPSKILDWTAAASAMNHRALDRFEGTGPAAKVSPNLKQRDEGLSPVPSLSRADKPHGEKTKMAGCFRKDLLPLPSTYYRDQAMDLIGKGIWQSALCPFHADKNPSLRIHVASGAFRCMSCDKKGGDVLAFHRLRYSLGFKDAAMQLGAWLEASL